MLHDFVVYQGPEFADPDVLPGRVIRTEPPAGSSAPREATITIFESLGPEPVQVPDVRGLS